MKTRPEMFADALALELEEARRDIYDAISNLYKSIGLHGEYFKQEFAALTAHLPRLAETLRYYHEVEEELESMRELIVEGVG